MLAALAHQLVQDVGDDQESYQQAFGTRSICLPAVTCRYRPCLDFTVAQPDWAYGSSTTNKCIFQKNTSTCPLISNLELQSVSP